MDESLQGLATLVVDDDSDIRKLMARILRLAGAEVSVASSVEDALQLLKEKRWDVVVTDIGMPRLSGYDLIRRARQGGYDVPMIAVTGIRQAGASTSSLPERPTLPARVRVPSHQAV